uniref:Protein DETOXIFICATION n=1 Tax=Oryza punctata TaxID=4537 RepID=A0A0E0LW06_ORYPU
MEDEASTAVAAPLLRPRGGVDDDGGAAEAKQRWPGARVAGEWWAESKKLWRIVGPAIFQRIALYGINVVSQAFIGHMGDLELAAFSIASTVVAGFNFGFLIKVVHCKYHRFIPARIKIPAIRIASQLYSLFYHLRLTQIETATTSCSIQLVMHARYINVKISYGNPDEVSDS